jgi:hypothetical protein
MLASKHHQNPARTGYAEDVLTFTIVDTRLVLFCFVVVPIGNTSRRPKPMIHILDVAIKRV